MRTRLFDKFADQPREFLEHFEILWGLPADQRRKLIPHVLRIYKTETTTKEKAALDNAVTELGGNAAHLLKALKLLLFIHSQWSPHRDTPQTFLRDLDELGLIASDNPEEARAFLSDYLTAVQSDDARRMEKRYAASLLPSFSGCSTLVDFRAVMRNPFDGQLEDNIEQYEPKCESFVPLILVKMRRDSGDPQSFEFQCEEQDIRRLIQVLEAGLKDLAAARLCLPKGGE